MNNKQKIEEAISKLKEAKSLLESAVNCYDQLVYILEDNGDWAMAQSMHEDIAHMEDAVEGITCDLAELDWVNINTDYEF